MSKKPMKVLSRDDIEAMIPSWYNMWLHMAAIAASIALVAGVCIWQLHDVQAWQLCAFVGALVFFNAYEYFAHRFPFHTQAWGDYFFYRHTIIHHGYFPKGRIGVESQRGFCWVLMPPFAFLAIVATISPVVAALWYWGDPNLAWLFLLAVTSYYFVYEIFHTLSHLPEGHPLAKNPIIRAVSEHHQIHHDHKLMRYNFGFFFPIWDYLMGTKYSPERVRKLKDQMPKSDASGEVSATRRP